MKDCKNVKIDTFVYRKGICNALSMAGIFTIGDVIKHREDFITSLLFSKDDFEHLKNCLRPYNEQMRGYRIEDDETRINKSMFSERTFKALKNGGIYTIEDIMLAGSKALSCLHNIDRDGLAEIKNCLTEMGYIKEIKSEQSEK